MLMQQYNSSMLNVLSLLLDFKYLQCDVLLKLISMYCGKNVVFFMLMVLCTLFIHINIRPSRQKIYLI